MVQTVQSLNSVLIIFWMRLSVAESTEAVASSSTKILACLSKARPRDTSCRWPTLQFSPFSRTARHVDKIFDENSKENQITPLERLPSLSELHVSVQSNRKHTWCIKLLIFIPDNLSKLGLFKCLKGIKEYQTAVSVGKQTMIH